MSKQGLPVSSGWSYWPFMQRGFGRGDGLLPFLHEVFRHVAEGAIAVQHSGCGAIDVGRLPGDPVREAPSLSGYACGEKHQPAGDPAVLVRPNPCRIFHQRRGEFLETPSHDEYSYSTVDRCTHGSRTSPVVLGQLLARSRCRVNGRLEIGVLR